MLLAVMSGSAAARWDKVGHTETYTAYVNPAAIRKAGNTVKVWQLFDYKTAQSSFGVKPYLSAKSQYEYDCKTKRTRLL